MNERIRTYEEFWPHYLAEHRNPVSRRLHFVGTTGFLASVAASAALNPVTFGLAALGFSAIMRDGMKKEGEKPSFKHVLGMVALPSLASPLFPVGVAWAYGCAWLGHFGFEKNRPATFGYPLWSLYSDFRMYGHMLQGRLWSGDDPVEALGLDNTRSAPRSTNGASASA
ncbi:MAG: DUF962 domain-containing protein [Myxococcales bacterium]|nr:DUF962 domain-containing protein [Myxococcales bacterium]